MKPPGCSERTPLNPQGASPVILKIAVTNPPTAESLCQRGFDLLAEGKADEAGKAFRAALIAAPERSEAQTEAHHGLVRALRDAGQLNQSVAAAMALIALTPNDPLAHTALSISLQHAGFVPEAEAASARARVLEWKAQLQSPPSEDVQP
jgi:Flp pilus assembly protein TadD